ncbi:MAG TPA: ribonuclease catalytic domain-containing protein [Rectinema sp.]|nr:ribonuclease catalytic domain-containing protein [Rectinema sp.]
MISPRSLVMYKTKPAIVISKDLDRILIKPIDGDEHRVRIKDLTLVHAGPIDSFPPIQHSIEVDEAIELLKDENPEGLSIISWNEFAELAWSKAEAQHIVIAWYTLLENPAIEILDNGFRIRSKKEQLRLLEKERIRKEIAEARTAFVDAFSLAWKKRDPFFIEKNENFKPFVDELSRFACGLTSDSPIARDLGIRLTPQAVHEALLATGFWKPSLNPWPERNGCILSIPSEPKNIQERPELALERLDLRHLPSFAIDNAWSKDPDDAISIEGNRIWVHVSDPVSAIAPISAEDEDARTRASTLYLPEKTIPMLHHSLIEAFGLGILPESRAISFGIIMQKNGKIEQITIVPSIIRVTRLTYEEADVLLETDTVLQNLNQIAEARKKLRQDQGAVDIEYPEISIRAIDGDVEFLPVPATRSAKLVQELMILAGEAAARWAYSAGISFPYVSQEPPISSDLAGCGAGPSESLAENYARRKVMRTAFVSSTCAAHAGLGLSFYSQVTSPLRRYQDMLAHYQIHAELARQKSSHRSDEKTFIEAPIGLSREMLDERLYLYSQQVAKNRQAERDSRLHWTMVYLSKHRDWMGQATVLEVDRGNAQIYIPSLGIEMPIRISRNTKPDTNITIALRRVSIPELSASFDVV